MEILGLESLTYGVVDMDTCSRFNEDFGLELVETSAACTTFRTEENATIILRKENDPTLPPAVTSGSQLRQLVWSVSSADVLEQIAAELSKDRDVTRDDNGTLWTLDPMGYGLGFCVTQMQAAIDEPVQLNTLGNPVRVNTRFQFSEKAKILHLGHVVIHAPNLQETYEFYTKRLGFVLTDSFATGQGYFLRSPGSHDHHNIFLFHVEEDLAGIDHASYALSSFDDVAMAGTHLEKKGWQSFTGPGRHQIGSNYFWYFDSPCGGKVEYYADMDYLTDDWVPREWEFAPEVVAAWDAGPGFAQ